MITKEDTESTEKDSGEKEFRVKSQKLKVEEKTRCGKVMGWTALDRVGRTDSKLQAKGSTLEGL
jgi:hypothetical protein